MSNWKRKLFPLIGISLGLVVSPLAFGQGSTTTTTTVQETVQTKTPVKSTRRKAPATSSSTKSVKAEEATTSTSVTTTTVVQPPPPPKEVVHKVYDEEALKKMSDTLCTEGFKAYVGTEKKNVCANQASAPDIAYSCVWDKKGKPAFAPTKQGPCSLDYTEHHGSIILKKENSSAGGKPPLPFGTEVQCCFRPAKGIEAASSQ